MEVGCPLETNYELRQYTESLLKDYPNISLIRIALDQDHEDDFVAYGTLWASEEEKKFVHLNLSAIEGLIAI